MIIDADDTLPAILRSGSYMAFLPNNDALNAYDGVKDSRLINYHISNLPYLVQDMPEELNTDLIGNPRVYVTKLPSERPSTTGWEHLITYINDAKIIDANHEAISSKGLRQMLHIVDRVITPTVPRGVNLSTINTAYLTPDAQKLLLKPHYYGFENDLSIKLFEQRVSTLDLLKVFNISGKNTFFIPTDSALNMLRGEQELVDKQVIDGHVVPNKVLFTRTVQDAKNEYKSLAFTDNLKVYISLENVTFSDDPTEEATYYVKSNTLAADTSHVKGTVLARIVKANIPVKNGVVHLIDRPLMIVATNIISYLQQDRGQLSKFYDLIRERNVDLSNTLAVGSSLTVFAPSNEAFKMVNKERFKLVQKNNEKISKLLRMHIVERRLTTDEIVDHTKEVNTLNPGRKLYFNVNDRGTAVPIVTLEGAGVNASITTPNIAAKNGVIHIIDRILGIPSQTVYEKLATDPTLSLTFQLSEQEGWNERLKNRNELFTFFVPSNAAWEEIHRTIPSAYKKLFMGSFSYHVRYILDRHMIANQAFSLDDLLSLTTNVTITGKNVQQHRLDMTRGKVYFQARVTSSFGDSTDENDTQIEMKDGNSTAGVVHDLPIGQSPQSPEYYTEWNGVRAHVSRPDMECVNGVVHVIDRVMMMNRDVTVSGSAVPAATGQASLVATFFTVAFARALHH
ncbi:fasciclin-1-like isoform X1 [Eriocheir sinensis]|uniref:fasciclin-1-like isoform X1 n=1 Tax=Eriocheir sinensis TaxID=95602 RepID=UPI0021C76BD0|nr:fasciclin-1-like isoform X1 [Eriocheir sinensis]